MLSKEEQFLWIVQTAILANGINLSGEEDTRTKYKASYSSTGVRITMREAVRAANRIPANMDAADAADEFCIYMFENHRDSLDNDDRLKKVPLWFAR
ncbi:hypothetical protein [Agrobacterium rubi]|uniref:Uncharacterized protein n=1 Tax=Agrobacterium rubi TaxID=28099 RepID=A0AAE7RAW0_9HYPH|nr:hypothetical protein [Agrobacterium rubi]NTE90154.1 hypothetical protein [Agrobacterium rubi]NTF04852.1 hypothetical protein [Agrobacterium rubi]NTF39413.1 hypothetical protein [Agrobacterium rubi]OCJ51105.1 hypothetical protein A6U92_05570 [Agrobacterium rubi]QTG03047.1 hypothetical protein G6M88_22075 [Agrobacterium rubi]